MYRPNFTCIDDNGDLCALYTGNVRDHEETYGMLARSTNGFLACTKKDARQATPPMIE